MTKQMMVLLGLIIYVVVVSVFIEPNSLEVTQYRIEDNSLQGARIAFLSDFHLKKNDYKRLDNIVELTNRQKPDMVLLGGDFAKDGNYSNMMNVNIMATKLSLINAPIYTVLGETDYKANPKEIASILRQNGIRVLENSSIRTTVRRKYIDIAGVMDISTGKQNLQKTLSKTRKPRVLLTHNPDIYYNVLDDVTLILAGHTHGGQFVPPFSPPLYVQSKFGTKFAKGLIHSSANKMIISKGLGTSGIPIRFNCKPEIVIIEFVAKGSLDKDKKKK